MSSFLRSYINIISTTSFNLGLVCSSAPFCHIEKPPFIDASIPRVFAGHTTAYILHNDLLIFSIRTLLVGFQKFCWTMPSASVSIHSLEGWRKMKWLLQVPRSEQQFKEGKNISCDWSICLLFLLLKKKKSAEKSSLIRHLIYAFLVD